ncbi:hypothetical protein [uncultured Fibrobacter sp.]|uniref:hypothetical protein n=1 Tax=uncultured Fibrobacter sp. TaxID=261512 RepID=UPI0025E42A70|nr:hypothetical protein [uncultured Fibrobacter sp.]
MSIESSKKINFSSEDVRKFASERFGTLKKLADAMGVSQPNLTQSLKGVRPFGALWRERLTDLGFFEWLNPDNKELIKDELIKDSPIVKAESKNGCFLDIDGALELSNTPASRMAQLIGVTPATFAAWQNGTATPTPDQLAALFNQVVALALSARTNRETKEATAQVG